MMKRHGWLWERLISFSRLFHAALNSARGKRWRPEVLALHADLEYQILALQDDLKS